jgi:cytidine deaminase
MLPCGICRQALLEFSDIDVFCCNVRGNVKEYQLSKLLPNTFQFNSFSNI